MTINRNPLMFRPPIFRKRWFPRRHELCAIPDLPAPPQPRGQVRTQQRLRPLAPREIPKFLLVDKTHEDVPAVLRRQAS